MTTIESLYVALLCISIVMLVLACLFILIKIFSFIVGIVTKKEKKANWNILQTTSSEQHADEESEFSSGELKLSNVDERTAAMIMAIVSDASDIPLSELCFTSIKAIENNMNDSKEATT